jgi:hypothetical protein
LSTTKYTDPIACSLVVIDEPEQSVVTVEVVEDPIGNKHLRRTPWHRPNRWRYCSGDRIAGFLNSRQRSAIPHPSVAGQRATNHEGANYGRN